MQLIFAMWINYTIKCNFNQAKKQYYYGCELQVTLLCVTLILVALGITLHLMLTKDSSAILQEMNSTNA